MASRGTEGRTASVGASVREHAHTRYATLRLRGSDVRRASSCVALALLYPLRLYAELTRGVRTIRTFHEQMTEEDR